MRVALALARKGVGDTSPNPAVGAVVVRAGKIVGRGYHRRAGLAHAEVDALRQAGAAARRATLYVTLEPCNHTGKTPPCCDAVLAAGVSRVVVGTRDPNPVTNGRGLARLRRFGVDVRVGVLEDEARRLNRPFAKYITTKRPWVIAKLAQSLDGKIATRTGSSRWISSEPARAMTHRLRREADAIVVGINTVLRDDPLLTVRDAGRPVRKGRPIKVIVDSRLRVPVASRCFSPASSAPSIVATTVRASAKRASLERRGVRVLTLPAVRGRVPLAKLFKLLAKQHQVTSILLEGGGELMAGALKERLVDRIVWYIAPMILGGRHSPSSVAGAGIDHLKDAIRLEGLTVQRLGPDLVVEAAVKYPARVAAREA